MQQTAVNSFGLFFVIAWSQELKVLLVYYVAIQRVLPLFIWSNLIYSIT